MGEEFIIVNPVKRQFIDIGSFAGGNSKASGVMQGSHSIAVAVLVSNLDEVRHRFGTRAGTWCGDMVIVAGEYGLPDQHGIKSSTNEDPQRNLFMMATEEFENITYHTLAMVCEGREGMAEEFVERAKDSPYDLRDLGNTVFQVGCEPLKKALNDILGPDWTKKYKEERRKFPPYR